MDKKFWAATFTLSGTAIGAGILGIPFVFSKSGFLIGFIWLIFLGLIMAFINLSFGEVVLRTVGKHQLSGYARIYLGKWAEKVMLFGMLFGIYSALLAYLIGEGESFSKILPVQINPFILGFLFWIFMTLLLNKGIRELKSIETYGVLGIIIIILWIFIRFVSQIKPENLLTFIPENFMLPFGVILFSLLGFIPIPEIRQEIRGEEKKLKKALIFGSAIPVLLYALFGLVFLGILGKEVNQVATLSFGPFVILLGIFTMLTSFFVLSFSLKDLFSYDFKLSRRSNFFFTSLLPLLFYLFVYLFNLNSFVLILNIGGIISGGITGSLILFINLKAKKKTQNEKTPKINVPMNWSIAIILSIIFLIGAIFGILPYP